MKCPNCGLSQLFIVDSRKEPDKYSTRRRRECLKCHFRFTTRECIVDLTADQIKSLSKKSQRLYYFFNLNGSKNYDFN